MADSVAGVVLAAGAGSRLRPLTAGRPKALCPVGGTPLVDHALGRLAPATSAVAVNLHHHAALLDAHLPPAVHRSVESPVALGTAGALGALRGWLDGRDVVVTNADAWFAGEVDVAELLREWDRRRARLLGVRVPGAGDFDGLRYCGVALMPWHLVRELPTTPSGLYESCWAAEHEAGRLDLVASTVPFVDCGTPADYLAANLASLPVEGSPSRWPTSVVDPSAEIDPRATVERSVVWAGQRVAAGEVLVDAIRGDGVTVFVR